MYNGFGINYKKRLQEDLAEEMSTYITKKGLKDVLGLPLLGYAFTNDKRFMDVFDAGLSNHPKQIYRPGTTVIVSFLPFIPEFVQDNFIPEYMPDNFTPKYVQDIFMESGNDTSGSDTNGDNGTSSDNRTRNRTDVSKSWTHAYESSIIVSAHINTFTLEFLDQLGREASLSTVHTDWNKETHRPEWSHKIAANIAGMGEFGPNGCIKTEYGPWGRFSSVITEIQLEPTGIQLESTEIQCEPTGKVMENEDEPDIVEDYKRFSLFEKPITVPQRVRDACPCGAINEHGIDQVRCQNYCGGLNEFIPEPDACGKCYSR